MLPERRKYINPKIPRQKKSILRIQGFKDFVTEKQMDSYPKIPKSVERTNYIE